MLREINFGKLFTGFLFLSVSFFLFRLLLVAGTDLRPIADDYCHGQEGYRNFFNNFMYWYSTWSGESFAIAISYIFLGAPLFHLPFGLGSLVALFATLMALGLVAQNLYSPGSTNEKKFSSLLIKITVFFFAISSSWIVFWGAPAKFGPVTNVTKLQFESIIHWQIVNLMYVFLPVVSLFLTFKLFDGSQFRGRKIFFVLSGLVVGSSGFVTAAAMVSLAISNVAIRKFIGTKPKANEVTDTLLFVSSVAMSFYLSMNSPGALVRRQYFTNDWNFDLVFSAAFSGIEEVFGLIFSTATLLMIIAGALLSKLLDVFNLRSNSKRNEINSIAILLLSFAVSAISKVSEVFSYEAFWHPISTKTFLFLALIGAGFTLREKLFAYRVKLYRPLVALTAVLMTVISIYYLTLVPKVIETRLMNWNGGPAPVYIGDTIGDREVEWINTCWVKFNEKKENSI